MLKLGGGGAGAIEEGEIKAIMLGRAGCFGRACTHTICIKFAISDCSIRIY